MGKGKLRAALIATVFLLLAVAPAWAQQSADGQKNAKGGDNTLLRVGGMSRADSLKHMIAVDDDGTQQFNDTSRDRDSFKEMELLVDSTFTGTRAESSTVLDWRDMKYIIIYIQANGYTKNEGANGYIKLAIQVRRHLNGATDSLSVFPVPMDISNAKASHPDSTLDVKYQTTDLFPTALLAGSNEFPVTIYYPALNTMTRTCYFGKAIPLLLPGGYPLPPGRYSIRVARIGASTVCSVRVRVYADASPL